MPRPVSIRPQGPPESKTGLHRKSGQAILESFAIIMLLCLILFGMVQYVIMLTATEVVQYSADASVRARAVGFNRYMVYKVNRVASIPNAGIMETPSRQTIGNAAAWVQQNAGRSYFAAIQASPRSRQYHDIEQYYIPLFLGAEHWGQEYGILSYEDWDTVGAPVYTGSSGRTVGVTVHQEFPLRMPFLRAFSDGDSIHIRKEAHLADHSDLYLE